ncbi:type III restriction-modification system endonuclease [Bacillus toyonensis]|uniref:type III restriction-modification system endonuclease n=1 Tax=Bacillus toyonensis TaxID=155322 RepID=UPI0002F1A946|nr:type III restriction-modification system endonuclease [Bacillus toyonensis]PEJ62412.1 type III restriction-modification system endonuclease [Bacillus toyonensis]PGB31884.1 type III restriction-modification system endonuclease [Bacillus toyonensis]PHG54323.1 type III restriction-modification system endonuclease [Bacillus toyonensis]PKR92793.1 DNA repair protein [Bacillus cereus Rock4-18]
MGFNFERNLSHQNQAVDAIVNVFQDVTRKKRENTMCNPAFNLSDGFLTKNIRDIQEKNAITEGSLKINKFLNLDIKMETGTGKTYTYTKTMFTLNREYDINKFIIVVPTIPIKLGTEQFLKSDSTRLHFKEQFGKEIVLEVLNSQNKSKKKKDHFPLEIANFVRASSMDNKIHVLLINTGMLNSKTMDKVFDDSSLFGYADTPLNLLARVCPFVFIDEPHKYKRNGVSYSNLLKLEPQCMIRYGATFPETKKGEKDYENLLYNLNAAMAFNQDLVKGVVVHIPKFQDKKEIKVTLSNLDGKTASFKVEYGKKEKIFQLSKGDSLSGIDADFHNINIENLNKSIVMLSNGVVLQKRQSIHPSSFSNTYQEVLIQKAIDEHFKKEIEFFRRPSKIKPLTLFFIDDISSYREVDFAEPYIKNIFERLLKSKIEKILDEEELNDEYKSYLQASLDSIWETHGGYFSHDNSENDEKIQNEVSEILQDKEKLLSYRHNDDWNVRRFIFSKWTLKEGWDNPNVFTICKLRSSGSEISKLQEVGRGLRLPVNEALFRVKETDFELSYIVDFTEKEFADQLVKEINADASENILRILSDKQLALLAKEYNKSEDDMFDELREGGFIDRRLNVIDEKKEELFRKYPILNKELKGNKIRKSEDTQKRVTIRQSNYNEFKELWEKINQKVFIDYKIGSEKEIQCLLLEVLKETNLQENDTIVISDQRLEKKDSNVFAQVTGTSYYEYTENLPYNQFLDIVSRGTSIPYQTIHNALVQFNSLSVIEKAKFFTRKTAHNIVKAHNKKISSLLLEKIEYKKIDVSVHPTAFTTIDGKLKKVAAHRLGTEYSAEKAPENYLYEELFYDSNEIDSIKEKIESIVVFGKIPQSSIKIPVINGQTYSPDFAYVIKGKDKSTRLHIVIESKNKNEEYLSDNEKYKIKLANRFFETINDLDINVVFETQMKGETITGIINNLRN